MIFKPKRMLLSSRNFFFRQEASISDMYLYSDHVPLFWLCTSILTVYLHFDRVPPFWPCTSILTVLSYVPLKADRAGPPCPSEKNPKKSEFSQNLFKILSRYSGIPGMLQSKFHVPQTILKGVTAIFPKMWKNPVFKEFSKTWSDIDRNSKIWVFMLIQVEKRCVD